MRILGVVVVLLLVALPFIGCGGGGGGCIPGCNSCNFSYECCGGDCNNANSQGIPLCGPPGFCKLSP